jgi:hypothetical protein
MTQAQEDAIKLAYSTLYEHFDGAVLAVVAEVDDGTDAPKEAISIYWLGGRMVALGLAHETLRSISESEQSEWGEEA